MSTSESNGLWVLVNRAGVQQGYIAHEQGVVSDKAAAISRELIANAGESWRVLTDQLGSMLATTSSVIADYHLDKVTVKLGIDGNGSIGVITAGVSASFEITFKSQKGT